MPPLRACDDEAVDVVSTNVAAEDHPFWSQKYPFHRQATETMDASECRLLREFWHGTYKGEWRWLRPWHEADAGASVVRLVRRGLVEMRDPRTLEYRITEAGMGEARAQLDAHPCACGHTNMAGCQCGSTGVW